MNRASILLGLALAACGNQPPGKALTNAAVPAGPIVDAPPVPEATPRDACKPPKLDFRAAPDLGPKDQARYADNFRVAFDKACSEGLMADEPLIDPLSADQPTLFVMNAPEANVTSIYLGRHAAPPNTLIETPFGDPPQIPSVDDLHEAIYCAVKGATEEEQETSGRCLPD